MLLSLAPLSGMGNNGLVSAKEYDANEEAEIEKIVNDYLDNISLWKLNLSYSYYGAGYLFLDVDFDNALELISYISSGTGFFTDSVIYDKLSDGSIIEYDWNMPNHDFYNDSFHLEIYYNKTENKYFYLSTDFLRSGIYYNGKAFSEMYGTGSDVNVKEIYEEGIVEGKEECYYILNSNNSYESVTKTKYNKYMKEYYSDKKNCNLEYEIIDAKSFNSQSRETQKNRLIKSYKAFYYDKEETKVFVNKTQLIYKSNEDILLAIGYGSDESLTAPNKISVSVSNTDIVKFNKYMTYSEALGICSEIPSELKDCKFASLTPLKEGTVSVSITNTDTDETIVSPIIVSNQNYTSVFPEDLKKTYNYDILKTHDKYNFYLNQMYISDYSCTKQSDGYKCSFNVFNMSYILGTVEVHNAKGEITKVVNIDKYTGVDSIFDAGKSIWNIIKSLDNILSFRDEAISKKSEVEVTIPDGGYMLITNDSAVSKSCFALNILDIALTSRDLIDGIAGLDADSIIECEKKMAELLGKKKNIEFIEKYQFSVLSLLNPLSNEAIKASVINADLTINEILGELGLTLVDLVKSAIGLVDDTLESMFITISGPYALPFKILFTGQKIIDFSTQLFDTFQYSGSNSGLKIVSDVNAVQGKLVSTDGISLDTNGNVEDNVILQTYRVIKDDTLVDLDDISDGDNLRMYDISLVKNGKEVQPDGKVKVYIEVPAGFGNNLKVVRYDSDKNLWETVQYRVINETIEITVDHFCLFAIVNDGKVKGVSVNDIETKYKKPAKIVPEIKSSIGLEYTTTYTSSNPNVVTIDKDGNITTHKKGSATITCTVTDEYGNVVKDTCNVNVTFSFGQWLIVILLFGWIWY